MEIENGMSMCLGAFLSLFCGIKSLNKQLYAICIALLSISFGSEAAVMKCQKVTTGISGGDPVYSTVCWFENEGGSGGGRGGGTEQPGGGTGGQVNGIPPGAKSPAEVAEMLNGLTNHHDAIQAYLDQYGSLISTRDFNKLRALANEISSVISYLSSGVIITDALLNQKFGKASVELVALITGVAVTAAVSSPMAGVILGAIASQIVSTQGEKVLIYLSEQYKVISYDYSHIPIHQLPCAFAGIPLWHCNTPDFNIP